MNCKPGDLAVIIGESENSLGTAGLIVEVLHSAPREPFLLPNGVQHRAAKPGSWVIRFQRPRKVAFGPKLRRLNEYAACHDSKLRPLPGASEPDATPAPSRELALA